MKVIQKNPIKKLIGYFAILWGISFLLNSISGIFYIGIRPADFFSIELTIAHLLTDIINLAIGVVLILAGYKLIRISKLDK